MKLATSILILYAGTALAGAMRPLTDLDDLESYNATAVDDPTETFNLEKRRSCSGHRKNYEVCQGNLIAKMNSRHNCYNAKGHCCAKNKNRDYGVTVSNGNKKGEDCGYCFTGKCKVERA